MDGHSNPVMCIAPVLTSDNVIAIAKLANKIPDGVRYCYVLVITVKSVYTEPCINRNLYKQCFHVWKLVICVTTCCRGYLVYVICKSNSFHSTLSKLYTIVHILKMGTSYFGQIRII